MPGTAPSAPGGTWRNPRNRRSGYPRLGTGDRSVPDPSGTHTVRSEFRETRDRLRSGSVASSQAVRPSALAHTLGTDRPPEWLGARLPRRVSSGSGRIASAEVGRNRRPPVPPGRGAPTHIRDGECLPLLGDSPCRPLDGHASEARLAHPGAPCQRAPGWAAFTRGRTRIATDRGRECAGRRRPGRSDP